MPRQKLGHFWMYARRGKVADELVAKTMKIKDASVIVNGRNTGMVLVGLLQIGGCGLHVSLNHGGTDPPPTSRPNQFGSRLILKIIAEQLR
ncbi:MAG TPA: hypothetical protein VFE62_25770 [Gemmataceae bacterium]|nr:hypothetical protein [Gemmataceae bacterium]